MLAMTLTIGDMAALTGMMLTITVTLGGVTKYYVQSEIRSAVNSLRLELVKARSDVLEKRVNDNVSETN